LRWFLKKKEMGGEKSAISRGGRKPRARRDFPGVGGGQNSGSIFSKNFVHGTKGEGRRGREKNRSRATVQRKKRAKETREDTKTCAEIPIPFQARKVLGSATFYKIRRERGRSKVSVGSRKRKHISRRATQSMKMKFETILKKEDTQFGM